MPLSFSSGTAKFFGFAGAYPEFAPSPPVIGKARAVSATAAKITFTAPTNPGSTPITQYTVTSNPGNITATVNQSSSGFIILTGLTTSVTYTFTVTATNSIGTSPPSAISNSAIILAPTTSIQYWLLAGGGGSGQDYMSSAQGGGGGGGYLLNTTTGVPVTMDTVYTVTVGAGGARNQNGINSSIIATGVNVSAIGGGRGSAGGTNAPNTGGSGGGGGGYDYRFNTGAVGYTGQGNKGGDGYNNYYTPTGGGGGGAGGVGTAGTSTKAGNGGPGRGIWGNSGTYYGAGGGGTSQGLNGAYVTQGYQGYDMSTVGFTYTNMGQGGGNGANSGSSGTASIRYPNSYNDAISTTGNPTYSNVGGYKTYTWTTSGSITF
jgi:hypothetical protein